MQVEEQLIVEQIQIGPMQNFAYIIGDRITREVVVIDPAWDIDGLLKLIAERDYQLTGALVTHYHPDHCGGSFGQNTVEGVSRLLEHVSLPVYAHELEADGVRRVTGISEQDIKKVTSGDKLMVGDIDIEFLHTPGHTPGSQCFRVKNTLVSGDTLFIDGCGRVDLPGSDTEDMFRSLQRLASLPDDTLLLPGHNYSAVPHATLGETKRTNTYLKIKDPETWKMMMGG
ncbi:MAG: MBL fold metallo-hydrolase [Gammaproteobacteria bacterium TMED95]|jgi:glyoxylase-like metal-dependent hydrolase (beta-lactamase superfamily II)|nr:MBL fold metallo-hydrolase [Gammaproteobacteria bacterium]OUV23152.1 MAG: MBL fold metallo-hydrolase [Gammaproteobacteria bacterium TMED95]